jgi:hypothetical protein
MSLPLFTFSLVVLYPVDPLNHVALTGINVTPRLRETHPARYLVAGGRILTGVLSYRRCYSKAPPQADLHFQFGL